jgi:hypothetical protein
MKQFDDTPRTVTIPDDLKALLAKHKLVQTALRQTCLLSQKRIPRLDHERQKTRDPRQTPRETIEMLETGKRKE